ncbi:MAG: hypothetical protein ABIO60_11970 [Aquaticitalea sp.]
MVFKTHDGMQYSAGSVKEFLKRYCKAANMHRTVTPYILRHS